ncbi:hypothetical protein NNL21_06855 [Paenibacillus mendelii]|nr:hypothetical protein [Paenibacillus mendelii]
MKEETRAMYMDNRPVAALRMEARDHGIILRYGEGPGQCDRNGMREAILFEENGVYHLFYDGCGPDGWLACLATSTDLNHWERLGPVLDFGGPGDLDEGTATSPWFYRDGDMWHMYYVGSREATPLPDRIPMMPYFTMKAIAPALSGPWRKQPEIIPFRTVPGTYYSDTASPGHIIDHGGEYVQFFSAAKSEDGLVTRTIGIARTQNLNGSWTVDPDPTVPLTEQIENSSVYYEKENDTWFLFTNHIGIDEAGGEYTDAIWVYWSHDPNRWNPENKAVVLDGRNCSWSKACIGLPTVVPVGDRLAMVYDAPGGDSKSHMRRDIGLAWLDLPLTPPK